MSNIILLMEANQVKHKLAYLASAYTHKSKKIMEDRYRAVSRLGGILFKKGIHNIAVISESHSVAKHSKVLGDTTWVHWRNRDANILLRCDQLLVCDFDGWNRSTGVKNEILLAYVLQMPIKMVDKNGNLSKFKTLFLKDAGYTKEEMNWASKFIEENYAGETEVTL